MTPGLRPQRYHETSFGILLVHDGKETLGDLVVLELRKPRSNGLTFFCLTLGGLIASEVPNPAQMLFRFVFDLQLSRFDLTLIARWFRCYRI